MVEAATIAADSLDLFIQKMSNEVKQENNTNQEKLIQLLEGLKEEDKYEMIKEVLQPGEYNFIVTPKEIDELIENMSAVVANGINEAM